MNFLETLRYLDIINESTNMINYKQLLDEINKLDRDIKELKAKKAKSWEKDYKVKFAKETDELEKLKKELANLKASYSEYWYTERDYDEDRWYDYDIYRDNEEKKAAVADKEAALKAKLDELQAAYDSILASHKADHEKAFSDLQNKETLKDRKVKEKVALTAKIEEEERAEINTLIEKIRKNKAIKEVSVNWKNLAVSNGQATLEVTCKSNVLVENCFDHEDLSFDISAIEEKVDEDAGENFYTIAYHLGIPDAETDEMFDKSILMTIPNSSWKLDSNYEVDYDEPEYEIDGWYGDGWNEPHEFYYDYDEYTNYYIYFSLIKDI